MDCRFEIVQITIHQLAAGLIATPPKTHLVSFRFEELPDSVRERAKSILSPNTVANYTAEPVNQGGADRVQLQIEYIEHDGAKHIRVDEAACKPEFLDLLDELKTLMQTVQER